MERVETTNSESVAAGTSELSTISNAGRTRKVVWQLFVLLAFISVVCCLTVLRNCAISTASESMEYRQACKELWNIEDLDRAIAAWISVSRIEFTSHKTHGTIPQFVICDAMNEFLTSVNKGNKAKSESLVKFSAAINKSLRLDVPDWYLRALSSARSIDGRYVSFDENSISLSYLKSRENSNQCIVGAKNIVNTFLHSNGLAGDLPFEFVQNAERELERDSAWLGCLLGGKQFAITVFDVHAARWFSFVLLSDNGNICWETKIWGLNWIMTRGRGIHRMSVLANDDFVAVLGIEAGGLYLEAFRRPDGKRIVQMNSHALCRFTRSSINVHD